MCGLVFAGGRHSLVASEINLFKQMLECDTYRGEHSTGVFSLFRPYNKTAFTRVTKMAVDGFDFVKTNEFANAVAIRTQSEYNESVVNVEFAKVLFGHNRHATMGAINAKNAHPFTHGHITLAHNGTLRNQSLLPDHKNFEVDSENICYSISKIGVDETIQKLHGAYALIWYNDEDKTINFIRNDERPFHFVETQSGDWFGASEKDMILWLMKRGKSSKSIKRNFEAEVGVHYVFDVSKGCELKEERKLELPRFQVQTSTYQKWGYVANDTTGTATSSPQQTSSFQKGTTSTSSSSVEAVLASLNHTESTNLKVGNRFSFECFEFKEYKSREGWGQVTGWLPCCGDYVEVQCHNVKKEDFTQDDYASAELVSAYIYMHTVHLIGKNMETLQKGNNLAAEHFVRDDDVEEVDLSEAEEDTPTILSTKTGELFAESGWRRSEHNTCANCSNPIPFEEIEDVEIINGYSFCGDCVTSMDEEDEKEELREALMTEATAPEVEAIALLEDKRDTTVLANNDQWCPYCQRYHNQYVLTGHMSEDDWNRLDSTCPTKAEFKEKFRPTLTLVKSDKGGESDESHARFHQPESEVFDVEGFEKTVRVNGIYVNEVMWGKINTCRACERRIPFIDAHRISFWGEAPLCMDCSTEFAERGF